MSVKDSMKISKLEGVLEYFDQKRPMKAYLWHDGYLLVGLRISSKIWMKEEP